MAVRIGVALTGAVVIAGVVIGVWGYSANRGTSEADVWILVPVYYGGIALVVIWLSVLIASVIGKAQRAGRT